MHSLLKKLYCTVDSCSACDHNYTTHIDVSLENRMLMSVKLVLCGSMKIRGSKRNSPSIVFVYNSFTSTQLSPGFLPKGVCTQNNLKPGGHIIRRLEEDSGNYLKYFNYFIDNTFQTLQTRLFDQNQEPQMKMFSQKNVSACSWEDKVAATLASRRKTCIFKSWKPKAVEDFSLIFIFANKAY